MPASSDCATLEVSVTSHIPAFTSAEEVSHKAKHLHTQRRTEDMGRTTSTTSYSAWNLDPGGIEAPWLRPQVLAHAQASWVGAFSLWVSSFNSPKSKTSTLGWSSPPTPHHSPRETVSSQRRTKAGQLILEMKREDIDTRSSQSGTEEQVKMV